jgi:hypothetical protein
MNKCGDGVVCDYSAATPTCIDAAADPDGDGIPNLMDHCPNAPGGLYDEDGDGIGDDCDRCPISKPPAVPDADGDDVDSPCDPDPHTPGDQILLFDGFGSGTLNPAIWTQTDGAWAVQGGELIVRLPTQAAQSFLTAMVAPQPNVAIQTSYRVDKLETGSVRHIVSSLGIDKRPAGTSSFECGVVKADGGTTDEIVEIVTDQGTISSPTVIEAFDTAKLYRSATYMTQANAECVVIGDNVPLATVQNSLTPDSIGQIKVTAQGVTARFQWVMVVSRSATGGPI